MFTLLNAAFVPNTVISSAAVNGDLSDIATAITQSLATTGVSSMTGPILAASGSVGSPGYSFSSDVTSGFYLAGTHQIGLTTNGVEAATFNSDQSVTWLGAQTYNAAVTHSGTTTLTGAVTFNATSYTFGVGAAAAFYSGLGAAASAGMIIDGGGSVVTTGQKGQLYIPFPMTITNWWIMADQSGSVTIDVLRANNAVPSVSIVGTGTKPNLSSSQFTSSAPAGWGATTLAANDFVAFNITGSPSNVTRLGVYLSGTRTG